jgi:hypothetical protein
VGRSSSGRGSLRRFAEQWLRGKASLAPTTCELHEYLVVELDFDALTSLRCHSTLTPPTGVGVSCGTGRSSAMKRPRNLNAASITTGFTAAAL